MVLSSLQHADHAGGVRPVMRLAQDLTVHRDDGVRPDDDHPVALAGPELFCHFHGLLERQLLYDLCGVRTAHDLLSLRGDHFIFIQHQVQELAPARGLGCQYISFHIHLISDSVFAE